MHFAAVLHILQYLKGNLFQGLHFSSKSNLTLRAYSDSDWAGDITDRRSTTGFCIFLGDSLISWKSKKQTVVARSSAEAEYCALAHTTSEVLWLRWLLHDMLVILPPCTSLFCDNKSAIQIAHNDVFMSAPSISRLIATSFATMSPKGLLLYSILPLVSSLHTSLLSLTQQYVFGFCYPNFTCFLEHLPSVGEGGGVKVNHVYYVFHYFISCNLDD